MIIFGLALFVMMCSGFYVIYKTIGISSESIRNFNHTASDVPANNVELPGSHERNRMLILWALVSCGVIGISLLVMNRFADCTVKPLTEQFARMQEQVAESNRLVVLGQLAAGVAHEINNPLGGITVYAHLLKEDTHQDDPRFANIEKIIKESTRCKMIVKSLLDFSRQSKPVLEKTDLRRIVVEGLNNIRREAVFGTITVIERYDENMPLVMADSSQIQEVCENIIRNAAEAMTGTGELTITCRSIGNDQARREVEILFEDTGPGISPEYIDRIFDPFYTTKLKGHGTGLGLTVSYGIVERHKGSISVRNREAGGVAFSLKLPVESNI